MAKDADGREWAGKVWCPRCKVYTWPALDPCQATEKRFSIQTEDGAVDSEGLTLDSFEVDPEEFNQIDRLDVGQSLVIARYGERVTRVA